MKGKIIKGISGFYYVHAAEAGIYQCRAKGIFRNRNVKPLVGDDVEFDITDEADKEGSIVAIEPRKNELHRPAVSNIDQALLVFAAAKPAPNFNLLDRFLIMVRRQKIPAVICFNKADLQTQKEREEIVSAYGSCGCSLIFTSAARKEGLEELFLLLQGKTSAAFGPSGVGKSTIINLLQQEVHMETGDISKKIGRGKNTTRHTQLIPVDGKAYIMDTPGFGSLDVPGLLTQDLWKCYEEFLPWEPDCRFQGCSHIGEPDCGVKRALSEGRIHKMRYENYVTIYQELKEKEKYEWR